MTPILAAALALFVVVTLVWIVSVFKKDVSIVDPCWAPLFLVVIATASTVAGWTVSNVFLTCLVGLWAIRLGLHLTIRGWGEPEDFRYQAFRRRFGPQRYWWFSYVQVFLLQGALAFVISAPLQVAALSRRDGLSAFDLAGAVVFAIGFYFEARADWELTRFKANPGNKGKLLTTGLWARSRHPNYFGNALLWWGLWICVLDEPWGGATVFAPALMTFLLLRVSGVSLLERHMKAKPGYEDYMRETPAFLPKL
ncbi:MAG: DUF1295 domain-containing protein [Myxococcota bacterium]